MGLGGEARKIVVEFLGDARGLAAASKEGEASLVGFSGKASAAGKIAGKALGGGLLLAAGGMYEASKAAGEDQASQVQLTTQLKNNTNATDEQLGKVNEWVEAQARAKGVAVDDLRPALAKLATATGDVGKAQSLLSLAMDISAGSGKSLDSVTSALVKAQNGSVGGLSKLGIKTKETTKDTDALKSAQISAKSAQATYTSAVAAHGKTSSEASLALDKLHLANTKVKEAQDKTKSSTIDVTKLTQQLSEKYSGAATKAADTLSGRQKILGVQMHEFAVQIGTAVMPVMEKLVDVGMKVVGYLSQHTKQAGLLLAGIGALLAVIVAVGVATKLYAAAQAVWSVATKLVTAGQWLLNAALDANPIGLVVLAIAALVAGFILAYKHSETFRNIINAIGAEFKKLGPIIGEIVGFIKDHWGLLLAIIGGPVVAIVVLVIKHFGTIKQVVGDAVGWVVDKAKDFGQFASAVGDHIGDAVRFFNRLPGKILDALVSLPGDLVTVGGQIVDGLKRGITNAWHFVTDEVTRLIDLIPKKIRSLMGIASPSKVTYALGEFISQGLADGIDAKSSTAETAAKKAADKVKAQLDRLKQAAASVHDAVSGAFSVDFGAQATDAVTQTTDAVTDAQGNVVTPASTTVVTPAQTAGQNFISSLTSKSGTLSQLIPAFKQLQKWGWKPAFLAQLFQSGNGALILELAANKDEADQAGNLLGQVSSLGNKLGNVVANGEYGDQIDAASGHAGNGGGGHKREAAGDTYRITITGALDPDAVAAQVEQMLHRRERMTGRKLLVSA